MNYELRPVMGKNDKRQDMEAVAVTAGVTAAALPVAAERMRVLAEKYPWFDSAVIASADGDMNAMPVHILLLKNFRPSLALYREPVAAKTVVEQRIENEVIVDKPIAGVPTDEPAGEAGYATIEIIDDFIDNGEHRVTPTDDTPEFIPENAMDGIPEDDELITEDLAEVYLNQGLFDKAKSIYERLSLLYPKKSVYFAEIIENASRGKCVPENNKNKKTIK